MVRRDILFVNDFDVLEDLLQVFDPGFDITLFVLGCIVFGVLREVALLSRFLDLLRYFFSSNNLEFVKLVLISLEALSGQNVLFLFHFLPLPTIKDFILLNRVTVFMKLNYTE